MECHTGGYLAGSRGPLCPARHFRWARRKGPGRADEGRAGQGRVNSLVYLILGLRSATWSWTVTCVTVNWSPTEPSLRGRTVCCAPAVPALCEKSAVFHPHSHGSRGPELCTLQPLLVHQVFFCFSLMLATGPRYLDSAPPMLF